MRRGPIGCITPDLGSDEIELHIRGNVVRSAGGSLLVALTSFELIEFTDRLGVFNDRLVMHYSNCDGIQLLVQDVEGV